MRLSVLFFWVSFICAQWVWAKTPAAPLSPEDAVKALVAQMTLDEKVSQLQNNTPAIPRLGIPKYEWWNEALHGVARAGGATVFPQAIGLAATFDPEFMQQIATVISDEARAKHHQFIRQGSRERYQGLTFWSPNINIFRDPRWGRGQETYGEDPYLTSEMGVAFVKGLQGQDGVHRKVDATAKHFAVHSGPEFNRHEFDAHPTERDLYETYLPAFRALVQQGQVAAVMAAYNRVNGESASASQRLLVDILRKDWGFKGYVVSDCDSVDDIYRTHKITQTLEEASALALKNGLDLNCGTAYAALKNAVKQGLVAEKTLDKSLIRLMSTRYVLGNLNISLPSPLANTQFAINQSEKHTQLARQAAQRSLVLLKNIRLLSLKNKSVLPLKKDLKSIAVIGPTADDVMALLGNYYGTPAHPITILEGIKNSVSSTTKVNYVRGVDLVEGREDARAAPVIDAQYLMPAPNASERGLKGEYFANKDLLGKPVLTRVDQRIMFRWDRGAPTDELVGQGQLKPEQALKSDGYSVRWTGQLLPPETGEYIITVGGNDGVRLWINDKPVIDAWQPVDRLQSHTGNIQMTKDVPVNLRLEYFEGARDAEVRLAWQPPGAKSPFDQAIEVAKQAEVIVFVGGLTGDVEGEEMQVNYPGFKGGDRTDIRLPKPQLTLLKQLQSLGKPIVLVLTGGSALGVDWAQQHIPAILMAWYPGQSGGQAVADVLFGDVSPSGRLPITFYKADAKLPAFDDYSMQNRTYRYYKEVPLYPFGHGLSYAQFEYGQPQISTTTLQAGQSADVRVSIKNTSNIKGREVVQLYIKPKKPQALDAVLQLKGVKSIELNPGEIKEIVFELKSDRDFNVYDPVAKTYALRAGDYQILLGASSQAIQQSLNIKIP